MKNKCNELYELSVDVFSISSMLLEHCEKLNNDETMIGIRVILKLLYKKSDDLCLKIAELGEEF